MTQEPLRFGILGFGHHAVRRLLPAFKPSQETVLAGMWRRNQAAALADCATHSIPRCFASREELCASPDIDAVFITSPDAMHLEDSLLALRHGKAVLCEKPLAMNVNEAAAMASAATAAGVLFGVAQNFRYNRSVNHLRDQIAAGLIGQPQFAHAQFCYAGQKAPRKWITDPALACGGPIGDVGIHSIDALRYILDTEVAGVSTLASQDSLSGGVEAYASMQLEMTRGIFAHVLADARAQYRTFLEVVGTEGVLTAENGFSVDQPSEVVHRSSGKVISAISIDNAEGYVLMLDSFAAAVRGETAFAATVDDGVKNMRVLDAAYKSWHSGQREMV